MQQVWVLALQTFDSQQSDFKTVAHFLVPENIGMQALCRVRCGSVVVL